MAVRFDAAESYNVTLTLGSQSAYTFACWAYITTDTNTFTTAWSFDNSLDGTMFGLQTDSDGTTMKVWDDNVGNFVATGPNMTVGVWYFFAVSVSGTSGTLYYKAVTASTLSTATWTGAAHPITRVLIGDDRYTEWINGRIAAFKFWTAGLTQVEIEREAAQYVTDRLDNLQVWYPFVRAETTDYSGNARTLSGGATTTTEDGPPIPWIARSPVIILPAAAADTNVSAEEVAYTVSSQDATSTVQSGAENVTFTVAAQDAPVSVKPNADIAAIAVTANNATISISSNAESVALAVTGQDAASTVVTSADVAPVAMVGQDATVSTATGASASADVAPVAMDGQDAAVRVGSSAAEAPVSVAGVDPSATVAMSAESVSAAVTAQDPQATIRVSVDLASLAVSAQDPTVFIGTVASAEVVTFTVDAVTAAALIEAKAEAASVGMTANNAVILTGTVVNSTDAPITLTANDAAVNVQQNATVTAECATFAFSASNASITTDTQTQAQAQSVTFTFAANDAKIIVMIVAEIVEIAIQGFPAATFQPSGSMHVSNVAHQSMIRLTQPTAEAMGISRSGPTTSVVDTAGVSMGASDVI